MAKIGIEDRGYNSLVQKLVQEGHKVVLHVEGIPFNELWPWKGVQYVESKAELLGSGCDFFIGSDYPTCNIQAAASLMGLPIVGHTREAIELELDRELAFSVVRRIGNRRLKTPKVHQYTSKDGAIAFLRTTKTDLVAKQHRLSPLDTSDNRTVLVRGASGRQYMISLLEQDSSPWFNQDGSGGVRFEQFIEGVEVCWGMMFSQSSPMLPTYWCQEYKGAQNGNRSGLLTGEVGTVMGMMYGRDNPVYEIFSSLGDVLRSSGVYTTGMIDFNTIVKPDGTMYFVEFTVRWGRPTMEMQIAMLGTNRSFGDLLQDAALGREESHLYEYSTAVGVTAFEYGLPYEEVLRLRKPISFKPPPGAVGGSFGAQIIPFFCDCSKPDTWTTCPEEGRYLVSVGSTRENFLENIPGKEHIDVLREVAYRPLEKFSVPGVTWRDDIGANLSDVLAAVRAVCGKGV